MAPGILVIDRNEAFATMLKQMLETEGGYEVRVAQRGSDALALLQAQSFALTIIDMDLDPDDLDYAGLIARVREIQPSMRLILIPLMGESLPTQVKQSDIQGTLSKPFFADDLLPRIEDALNRAIHHAEPQPDPDPAPEPQASEELEAFLYQLAREIYADAVLLLSTRGGTGHLIAHASSRDEMSTMKLADLSMDTIRTAQAAARFLGQPDGPFEHNMFETDSLRLYAMSLPGKMLLTVVTPTSTPLGTIRHNLRRAARELSQLALG